MAEREADSSGGERADRVPTRHELLARIAQLEQRMAALSERAATERTQLWDAELPLGEQVAAAASVPAPASQKAATAGRRVLIIEDNRDAALTLAESLELWGHHVEVAYAGASGLSMARASAPEIVLCDIGLPGGLDGYAVARALRRDPAAASTYLVALTGYAQPEDQRRAREAGFDAHVAKPPDPEALRRLLAQAPVHDAQPRDRRE